MGHESKRLFIAVDIDETTREQVGRISTGLREAIGHTKASWVRQDRMHLTLHFFGSADTALEARVRDTLAGSIAAPPFDVSFDGLGFFPERGSPRVLWLGVGGGLEQLRRLQRCPRHPREGPAIPSHTGGSFNPHLTWRASEIAFARESSRNRRYSSVAGPARIDRVTLYESRLSPAGPTYVPLAEALLIPSG